MILVITGIATGILVLVLISLYECYCSNGSNREQPVIRYERGGPKTCCCGTGDTIMGPLIATHLTEASGIDGGWDGVGECGGADGFCD